MKTIEIVVNGEKKKVQEGLSVQGLLELMDLKDKMLVIERNKQVVDKNEHESCKLKQGDTLEIVGFFGGG